MQKLWRLSPGDIDYSATAIFYAGFFSFLWWDVSVKRGQTLSFLEHMHYYIRLFFYLIIDGDEYESINSVDIE